MEKNVLAIDIGSSSGRAIVGNINNEMLEFKEVYRFENVPLEKDGVLYWDVDTLFNKILKGIKIASSLYDISSIGIDTWGVDFGLIDVHGELIDLPVNYRDQSTKGLSDLYTKDKDTKNLYQETGNQVMDINTLFRLLLIKDQKPEILEKTDLLLMMPDLFNYMLTGQKATELSIASTTQLFNPFERKWNEKIIEKFDLPFSIFPEVTKAGTVLGYLKKELADELEIGTIPVVSVCGHDTANAIFSVSNEDEVLFTATGTWMIIGVERNNPVISEKSMNYNLTNEIGYNGRIDFTKNVTGLWIIQELKKDFELRGKAYSFTEMLNLATGSREFICLLDTDHPSFAEPGDMINKIKSFAKNTNQEIPQNDGEYIRTVYEGLALKHKQTFMEIEESLSKEYDRVYLIGGGTEVNLLCQMIADATNKKVITGAKEATAIGNLMIQLITLDEFSTIEEAKELIKNTYETVTYTPINTETWSEEYKRLTSLIIKKREI